MDLFSGIGGFALAAKANDVDTVTFCELDLRCRTFLERAWPGIPVHDDARTFPGERYRGTWLLTGGVPCQPASRAGKQRGAADDRWLWKEALACLAAVRPTWALFENPPGIGDVGLAGICDEMGAHGYEVQPISLPAAAVGAPHRRERYWILAHATDTGRRFNAGAVPRADVEKQGTCTPVQRTDATGQGDVANPNRGRCEPIGRADGRIRG